MKNVASTQTFISFYAIVISGFCLFVIVILFSYSFQFLVHQEPIFPDSVNCQYLVCICICIFYITEKKHLSFFSRISSISCLQNDLVFSGFLLLFRFLQFCFLIFFYLIHDLPLSSFMQPIHFLTKVLWWCICTLVLFSINTFIGSLI